VLQHLPAGASRAKAILTISAMVGGMTLARATASPPELAVPLRHVVIQASP
jgi:hypothetical protein